MLAFSLDCFINYLLKDFLCALIVEHLIDGFVLFEYFKRDMASAWLFVLVAISLWLVTDLKCGTTSRRCKCRPSLKHVRCIQANLGRVPHMDLAIRRQVVTLNLVRNLIGYIEELDLEGFDNLRRLDVRLQLTATCVRSDIKPRWDLMILGLCAQVNKFLMLHFDIKSCY